MKVKYFRGDCLYIMDKLIEKGIVVDAIICDLPYGVTKANHDIIIPFDEMWKRVHKIVKPNGAVIFFGQDKFTAKLMLSNEKEHRYNIIWKKGERGSGFLNSNRMPLRNHEDIMIFYKKLPTYNPQFTIGKPSHSRGKKYIEEGATRNYNYGEFNPVDNTKKQGEKKFPISVLNFERPHPPKHATEKPIDLIEWLVKTYSNENETILDFTMGSGTTGIACINTNRNFIGIEIKEKWYRLALQETNKILNDSVIFTTVNIKRKIIDLPHIDVSIWTPYNDGKDNKKPLIEDTFMYIDNDDITETDQHNILEYVYNYFSKLDNFNDVSFELIYRNTFDVNPDLINTDLDYMLFKQWQINISNLEYRRRKELLKTLNNNLLYETIPLKFS
jgi:site-specific DNA-methyltransferase (adenine-specific)